MIFLPGALPWGSLVAFLAQTLPLYPSGCPLLFQILLFSSTSLVASSLRPFHSTLPAAHGLLFSSTSLPVEGCSAVTHSSRPWQRTAHRFGMRSSQDRSHLATGCDGHSFPCEPPGIFALTNSGSVDCFYHSPLCGQPSLQTYLSEKGETF